MSPRKCKEIDQMYLNVYYFRCAAGTGSGHVLSIPPRPWFASSALVDPISKTFVAALEDFARRASANRLKTCHRQVGFQTTRRLLDVQKVSHDCPIGKDTFERVVRATEVEGRRAPALRFGDKRVQA